MEYSPGAMIIGIILILLLISAGCITHESPEASGTLTATPAPDTGDEADGPVSGPNDLTGEKTLKGFIEATFPELTTLYNGIQMRRVALDWTGVQSGAHDLEIRTSEIIQEFGLDQPLPEKKVFHVENAREEIILKKYIGYIMDTNQFAANLKEAVYWQEKPGDRQAELNVKRFQDLADEFEKKMTADIKSVYEYGEDFGYQYLGKKDADIYSFIR